ncbi:MAG TPA: EAL domain-containing protein [Solirubrobacteraceae bacterium]|nr:EAL domain-containing protein [Solirubrobacteraceae bacterium]
MLLPDDTSDHGPGDDDAQLSRSPGDGGALGRRWLAAMCALAVLCVAASVTAALMWRSSVRARERQTFQTAAADVSGRLETSLRRDTDFVRSVRAILSLQPNLTASGYGRWLSLLEDREGEPTGYGALIVKRVPAAELGSFQAQRNADPAFRTLVGGHLETVAASGRSHYCLLAGGSAALSYDPEVALLLQGDWCDPTSLIGGYAHNGTTRAQFTQAITDDGGYGVYSLTLSNADSLIIEVAAYRPGAALTSVAQRQAAVLGWVLGSFSTNSLMHAALAGAHDMTVSLYHANPGLGPEFIGRMEGGKAAHAFTDEATLHVDGTWIVKVTGAPALSGPSADIQAVAVFVGGMLASALLLALVLVLARSREHALAMVREKTGQLRHQALHDALTGLPNRVLALDRAEQMLARARRQQLPVAALYVDVDDFKDVNDSFGHAAGDELLRIVASRLESVVREGDTAARLGGDEFVVLVEGSTLDAGPELVAERLLEALRRPYDMRAEIGRELSLSASVGIAYGLRGTADELLREADIALYAAKAAGRNRFMLFHANMQSAVQDRLATQMDLIEALERDELFLLYRPTFDLQSERVAGVEALVRWRHPTRGTLAPREFLPIAEASGLSVAIGRWVLAEACRRAAGWHERGLPIGISVNVAARQLETDELVEHVAAALRDSGLEPRALTLEVSESALLGNPQGTGARLRQLAQLGVRIAIDDFGARYSALTSVHELPADAVKLDRALVDRIASSPRASALLQTFVAFGKTLALDTLAEGVEDHIGLAHAQREQCDRGHGFLFSRALDEHAIEAFLRAGARGAQAQAAGG